MKRLSPGIATGVDLLSNHHSSLLAMEDSASGHTYPFAISIYQRKRIKDDN